MKTELLLPVGNFSMLHAAIHHGADAVYIGVPYFNARGRSADFTIEELKEMIDHAHLYGVKVNLAFNVVIFQNEFTKVINLLEKILPMGPDAFIVQDLGLAALIRSMAPEQRIHASTQMTVTNADAIKLLADLKIDRFVLGRENSLPEIEDIRKNTDKELEIFVHGALCVAYSGQCFTSESLGGRSANRGQCAQSCRLPYELYVDNQKKDMGDKKYLVSPKDLMGLEEVPQLVKLGINSFKIEGRLKTPEYVAATAKNYREVLDGDKININQRKKELSVTYSRGFFSGWLKGVDHQQLVDGTYSAHRGLKLGVIKEVKKSSFIIDTSIELHAGAGLLIVGKQEVGSKIFKAIKLPRGWEVELVQKKIPLKVNDQVFLNSDEKLDKQLQKGWQTREGQKKIPVEIFMEGNLHQKLKIQMIDPEGRIAEVFSTSNLQEATHQNTTAEMILDEISSLGASVYKMQSSNFILDKNIYINLKEIKEMKRALILDLNLKRIERFQKIQHIDLKQNTPAKATGKGSLNILLRNKDQVDGLIQAKNNHFFKNYENQMGLIILDFEFGKDYAPSIEALKNAGYQTAIATTRILKPKEYHNLKLIMRIKPDKILVRNLGALEFLKNECDIPLLGDFSLNVTNSFSHNYLLKKGLETICVSYDLNQTQLFELLDDTDPTKVEVTIHQYMPEFHMEHCVFAAFLSKGSSFKDCGKPCEKHEVKLKDPYGNWHYLKPDHECRNTFYKATPQSASFLVQSLLEKHIGSFRIEALNETSDMLNHKILTYLELLHGKITSDLATQKLKLSETYGLGMGQLNKEDTYQNRKH
jgi:putative protease